MKTVHVHKDNTNTIRHNHNGHHKYINIIYDGNVNDLLLLQMPIYDCAGRL